MIEALQMFKGKLEAIDSAAQDRQVQGSINTFVYRWHLFTSDEFWLPEKRVQPGRRGEWRRAERRMLTQSL